MPYYHVYGSTVASRRAFVSPLRPALPPASLHIDVIPGVRPLDGLEPVAALEAEQLVGASLRATYRPDETYDLIELINHDQLEIGDERLRYRYRERPGAELVDVQVLGNGLAWWLLRRGRLPLHAGAVVHEGGALLVMAESGAGKSSLICSLLARGLPLLADDFVALEVGEGGIEACAAYPQLRLWPETIERFVGDPEDYPGVLPGALKRRVPVGNGWGRFLDGSYPVARIYQFFRDERRTSLSVQRVSGHDAYVSLLTSILLGPTYPLDALRPLWAGVERVANEVPVYRIEAPSGWGWLPRIHEAVLDAD